MLESKRSHKDEIVIKQHDDDMPSIKIIKSDTQIKRNLIIADIESIYSNIIKIPGYYIYFLAITFIIILLNESITWSFQFLYNSPRQNFYCYNTNQHTMELVDYSRICRSKNAKPIFIYPNESNYTTLLDELSKASITYSLFFYNHTKLFYSSDKFNLNNDPLNGCVLFKKYEKNILINWHDICSQSTIYFIILSIQIGLLIGNLISILADIYGRKFFVIFGLFCSGLGAILFYFLTYLLKNKVNKILERNQLDYDSLKFEYIKTETNQKVFSDNEFLFFLLIFIISIGKGLTNASLFNLLMEFSINDNLTHKLYFLYYNAFSISLNFSFLLNYTVFSDNYENYFLCLGLSLCILGLAVKFLFYDSPRFHFEYSNWEEFTYILENLFSKNYLDIFYVPDDINSKIVDSENLKRIKFEKLTLTLKSKWKLTYYGYFKAIIKYFSKHHPNKNLISFFTQKEIIQNPWKIPVLFFFDKEIKEKLTFLTGILIITNIIYHINNINLLSPVIFTLEYLYENKVYYTPYNILMIITMASNYIFHKLYPLIGIKVILVIGFTFCLISSILRYFTSIFLPIYAPDQNIYTESRESYFLDNQYHYLNLCCTLVFSFFINGIFYSISLYLLSYSKTAFRSFLWCYNNLFVIISFSFAQLFVELLKSDDLLLSLYCAIAIVVSIFIKDNNQLFLIKDSKKLE